MAATLEQERSAYAWKKVDDAWNSSGGEAYVNLLKGLPAMVMGNGLLQTLAYLTDKGKVEHRKAKELVVGWLKKRGVIGGKVQGEWRELEELTKLSSARYMQATEEALAVLRWARQFAAARSSTAKSGGGQHG